MEEKQAGRPDQNSPVRIRVRELNSADYPFIKHVLAEAWGSPVVVTMGKRIDAGKLPGFIALINEEPLGLVTYLIENDTCEITTLNALQPGSGIGTVLVSAVREKARTVGCRMLRVITTNDNTKALRFYQQQGFELAALRPKALKRSRELKPEIPLIGMDGIPIRDELELEMAL